MNYFEYVDKRPALDVIEWPGIEVTETELTLEEIRQWKKTRLDSSEECFSDQSPE